MSRPSWEGGFRKVGRKTRTGSGAKKTRGHVGHRKKLPSEFDRVRAVERRSRILELRESDLETEADGS